MADWAEELRRHLRRKASQRAISEIIKAIAPALRSYQQEVAYETEAATRRRKQREAFKKLARAVDILDEALSDASGFGSVGTVQWVEGPTEVRTGNPFAHLISRLGPAEFATTVETLKRLRALARAYAKGGAGGRTRKDAQRRLTLRVAEALAQSNVKLTTTPDGTLERALVAVLNAAEGEGRPQGLRDLLSLAVKHAAKNPPPLSP
jgi:hypothetical protein